MASFRTIRPIRTYNGPVKSSYRDYKQALASDFRNRCGYTGCSHFWFGGSRTFHIDHFKPKSTYPHLERAYSNLVYVCSYVNIAKSDDEGDYIDPCDTEYNDHFERDDDGNILPITGSVQAAYMYKKLKLYLKRYGIIWQLELLQENLNTLGSLVKQSASLDLETQNRLLRKYFEVSEKFRGYLQYLEANQ